MKKVKFKVNYAGKGGWCDWQFPVMKKYLFKCCDCGLVHEMEFQVVEIIKEYKNGTFSLRKLNPKKYRVGLRAKRKK